MGLEAATYISDLDATNPLAGDRKNQGDDHLRLLKGVLRTTFPNADRGFRFPGVLSKSGAYSVVAADDSKLILCDTSGAGFNLTLPVGATLYAGWQVSVMLAAGTNPVFVIPPSGLISSVAKIRVQIPSQIFRFLWDGSAYWWLAPSADGYFGQIITFAGALVPTGFGVANGQSLLRADHPILFAIWSTTFGAADGTHFNAPNLLDRFIVGAGSSYALGATGGEATHILSAAEMPVHTHGIAQNPHDHGVTGGTLGGTGINGGTSAPSASQISGVLAIDITPANADITINNAGSGGAHENRPPYMALQPIFRLL